MNRNQYIAIGIAIVGVLSTSAAQLTDLFGAAVAKDVVSTCGLLSSILSVILSVISSTPTQIQNVNDLPGVDKILINRNASQSLASLAVDPSTKIEATPGAEAAVSQIAKSG